MTPAGRPMVELHPDPICLETAPQPTGYGRGPARLRPLQMPVPGPAGHASDGLAMNPRFPHALLGFD